MPTTPGQYWYSGGYHTFPGASGIFLASVGPVPVGTGAGQNNNIHYALLLQYDQTKEDALNDDDMLWLPMGRGKPVTQTSSQVFYETFTLAYAWPPGTVALDGTTAIEAALRGIKADCRNGYLVELQTSQSHGAAYNGKSENALYGRLQNLRFTYPTDRPGWSTMSATFTEVG